MRNFSFIEFLLVISMVISGNRSTLPPAIKTCPRNSPRLADCIKDAILSLRGEISHGNIKNYVVFEEKLVPLEIGNVVINRSFYLHLQNLVAHGVQDFIVDKLRINVDNFKLEALVTIPKVEGSCQYSLQWLLSIFNLQGNGMGSFNMENVKVHMKLTGSRYLKNGQEYLKIDHSDVKIKSSKILVYFHNLFKGNKVLEKAANEVINQNVDQLTGDIYPAIEQVISKKLLKISNQIFAKDTFNEFFPPR